VGTFALARRLKPEANDFKPESILGLQLDQISSTALDFGLLAGLR
jgi:hypothetical protein